MKHCVAARLVVLEVGEDAFGTQGHANGMSVAMIVRPMSIVSILDVEHSRVHDHGISMKLSDKCQEVLGLLSEIPDWYPEPDPDAEFPFSIFGGAPVTQRSRKKRTRKAALKALDQEGKKKKRSKRSKKKKENSESVALKKSPKEKQPLSCVPENFRRTITGRQLIRDTLQKLLEADLKAHPNNPLFATDTRLCRLKADECKSVTWEEVISRSSEFFIKKFLS